MKSFIPFAFLLLSAANAFAQDQGLVVDSISTKLFSKVDGKTYPLDAPPNPYGLFMDLLVTIVAKGTPLDGDQETTLVLSIKAPGWSDEATGDHPDWNAERKFSFYMPDEKTIHLLSVLPYEHCYPSVTIEAVIAGDKATRKSKEISLACAE